MKRRDLLLIIAVLVFLGLGTFFILQGMVRSAFRNTLLQGTETAMIAKGGKALLDVEGSLSTNAPFDEEAIGNQGKYRNYYDAYQIPVSAGDRLRIRLDSRFFVPVIILVLPDPQHTTHTFVATNRAFSETEFTVPEGKGDLELRAANLVLPG